MRLLLATALTGALVAGSELAHVGYQAGMLLLGAGRVEAQSGAPIDATYITQTANGTLSAEQALESLSNGLLKHAGGVVAQAVPGTDYSAEVAYRVSADVVNSTVAFADVLTWPIAASAVQIIECHGFYSTAATTTALQLALNGPASPTTVRLSVETATTATARHNAVQTAYEANTNPATGGGATALPWTLRATIENGSNAGTVALRARSEIAASAATVARGSVCEVR